MKTQPYTLTASDFVPGADAQPVIQQTLDLFRQVVIEKIPYPLQLGKAVVVHSGTRLTVHPETVLTDREGCGGCLLRNEHIVCGLEAPEPEDVPRDENILVEGGVWQASYPGAARSYRNDDHPVMRICSERNTALGVLSFCNAEHITVRNVKIAGARVYGVFVCRCRDFLVEKITFERQGTDGVHINGPSSCGTIRQIRGKCGDDIFALNAWDWHESALCFGAISDILVEDVIADFDEARLLPGTKKYASGEVRDCSITNCTFRRIEGLYTIKMYQQPYYLNSVRGLDDRSLTPGLMKNITFEDFRIAGDTNEAMSECRLSAFWEIGADIENAVWKNIAVDADREAFQRQGMTLASVGPKSSTYTRGDPDPETWIELFEPDLICRGNNLRFENVTFAGEPCRDEETILKAVHLTVNPDYPRTKPKGGTGYGVLTGVTIR